MEAYGFIWIPMGDVTALYAGIELPGRMKRQLVSALRG
jgi:hypothetical protein